MLAIAASAASRLVAIFTNPFNAGSILRSIKQHPVAAKVSLKTSVKIGRVKLVGITGKISCRDS